MSNEMYDSITLSTIPANPYAVAGYVGGRWPDYSAEVVAFPNAKHLSIAVNAEEDAECLDIENGDAIPSQAPAWVKRQQGRGVQRPVVYASVSNMRAVLDACAAAGIQRSALRVWTAHYVKTPHICSPACGFNFNTAADATQWTDVALGRNLDESALGDWFFGDPAPPVKNAPHYDWFDTRKRPLFAGMSEQTLVKAYDALRATQTATKHPNRYKLGMYRILLAYGAGRVWRIAHKNVMPDGKPSWGVDHRGWRFQQLSRRKQGQRLA